MSTVGEPIKVKSRVKKSGKKFRAEVGLRADARLCCAGYPVSIGRRAEQESSEKEISCRGLPTGRRPVMFFCRWLLFSSRSSGQVPLARRGSYPMSAWSVSRHPLASRKKERKKVWKEIPGRGLPAGRRPVVRAFVLAFFTQCRHSISRTTKKVKGREISGRGLPTGRRPVGSCWLATQCRSVQRAEPEGRNFGQRFAYGRTPGDIFLLSLVRSFVRADPSGQTW